MSFSYATGVAVKSAFNKREAKFRWSGTALFLLCAGQFLFTPPEPEGKTHG